MTTKTKTTKTDARYAVVLSRPHRCDRYLTAGQMAWSLDPADADLMTREAAEAVAEEFGGHVERM